VAGGAHVGHPEAGRTRPSSLQSAAPRLASGSAAIGVSRGHNDDAKDRVQPTEQRQGRQACSSRRDMPSAGVQTEVLQGSIWMKSGGHSECC
jgi:hypothetical protein